jgi:hypothetical protein
MPKTSKRPREVHDGDVVIEKGWNMGYDADVAGVHIREVETLEEAEALVRAAIKKHYPKGSNPTIYLKDSEGMFVVE